MTNLIIEAQTREKAACARIPGNDWFLSIGVPYKTEVSKATQKAPDNYDTNVFLIDVTLWKTPRSPRIAAVVSVY